VPAGLTLAAVIATVPSEDNSLGSISTVGPSSNDSSELPVSSRSWSSSPGFAMTKYRPPRSHGTPRRGAVTSAVISARNGVAAGSASRYGVDRPFWFRTNARVRSESGSSR